MDRGTVARGCALLVLAVAALPDGRAQRFIAARVAPPDGAYHAAAYDERRDRIVLVGGLHLPSGGGATVTNDVWEYDGAAWVPGVPLPGSSDGRFGHAMAYDAGRACVVLTGGMATAIIFETWELDGTAWVKRPAAPVAPRYHHGMVYDARRARMVLFGGLVGLYQPTAETWEYDGTNWTPGAAAPGPAPRFGHGMAFDAARGVTVVFGGFGGTARYADTWIYDGSAWSQGPTAPPALSARVFAAMAFDAGRGVSVLQGGDDGQARDDTWELDATGWRQGAAAATGMVARSGHTLVGCAGRGLVLSGGAVGGYGNSDTWVMRSGTWEPGASAPDVGRDLGIVSYDEARRVTLLLGADGAAGTTWQWDGSRWSARSPAPVKLQERSGHVQVFDSARGRTVVFGGAWMGQLRNDVLEYDGSSWQEAAPTPAAVAPRTEHAAAYDPARGRVVVFGGTGGGSTLLNDTWEYDGIGWTAGPAAPPGLVARALHAMAFDPVRGATVLFGGRQSAALRDTWLYDGVAWSLGPAPPAAMAARYGHAMAFDAARGVTLVFGGHGSLRDLWELDGSQWRPGVSAPAAFVRRDSASMAYDVDRRRAVIFGGSFPLTTASETWELGTVASNYVMGAGLGPPNPNRVRVAAETGQVTSVDFMAYTAGRYGVNVAAAPIDGAATDRILTGPGPGPVYGPRVRAFQRDGTPMGKVDFFAYGTLRYGVNVAGGDVDGDARAEMVTAPGPGTAFGPHVRGFDFDGVALTAMARISFYAFGTLRYGCNAASGTVDADGFDELLAGPGPGPTFAPLVRAFDYDGGSIAPIAAVSFWAFPTLAFGATVAAGDPDADGFDEMTCGAGPGGSAAFPAHIRGFDYDGAAVALLPGYDVVAVQPSAYGARPALGDVRGSARHELLAGIGPDPTVDSGIHTYTYDGSALQPLPPTIVPFRGSGYGVTVAAGRLGY